MALGVGMPANARFPRWTHGDTTLRAWPGLRIVELSRESLPFPDSRQGGLREAIRVLAPSAESTNAVIHLTALARRIRRRFGTRRLRRLGRGVHTLVNLMPSGKYLMEDFYYAGGLPAVLRELGENDLLQRDALTVTAKTIGKHKDAPCWNRDVIHGFKSPFKKDAGIAVLRGNLCPRAPSSSLPQRRRSS